MKGIILAVCLVSFAAFAQEPCKWPKVLGYMGNCHTPLREETFFISSSQGSRPAASKEAAMCLTEVLATTGLEPTQDFGASFLDISIIIKDNVVSTTIVPSGHFRKILHHSMFITNSASDEDLGKEVCVQVTGYLKLVLQQINKERRKAAKEK